MKLHHMRHFDAVAQHGSLHAAARALGVAQSALSRSIRELEQDLAVPLLMRGGRGVALTEAGRRFLARARRVQAEIAHSREEAAQAAGEQAGQVTVGISATAQLVLLPAMVARFRRTWPGVRLAIVEGAFATLQPRLLDGSIDFCIGGDAGHPIHPGVRPEFIASVERVVVSRPGHPAALDRDLDPADLEWIDLVEGGPAVESEAHHPVGATGLLAIAMLLAHSDMVAVLPRACAELPGLGATIEILDMEPAPEPVRLSAFSRASVPLTPAGQALYDAAVRQAEGPERRSGLVRRDSVLVCA